MATRTRSRSRTSPGYIAPDTLIEADFSKGMVSDADPAALAPGQLVSASNMMLDKTIPYKRGGSEYFGGWVADSIARVVYAEFPRQGRQEVLAFDANTNLYYKVESTGSEGQTGPIGVDAGSLPAQRPVIVPDADAGSVTGGALMWGVAAGNNFPRVYTGNGAAPRQIAGATGLSPSTGGRYAVYYKSRLVLASSTTYENRMWFSPAGVLSDVEGDWDLTNSWIDFDFGITGLATLQNSILVFSRSHVERLTGSTPPQDNGIGGDMSHGPILTASGCSSARSIAYYRDSVIWANPQGVFMSSGVGADDLTEEGGMLRDWQTSLEGWDDATSTISGEVIRHFYVVSTATQTGNAMWVCDIPRRAWWKVAPGEYDWFAANPLTPGDLYASRNDGHVYNLKSYFNPDATARTDADGASISASLQTRFVNGGQVGLKHFRDARALYELTSAISTATVDVTVTGETNPGDYIITYAGTNPTANSDTFNVADTTGMPASGTISLFSNGVWLTVTYGNINSGAQLGGCGEHPATVGGEPVRSNWSETTTLPEGALHERETIPVGTTDQGVQFTVTQDDDCDSFRLYGFEVDYRPLPLSRGGSA